MCSAGYRHIFSPAACALATYSSSGFSFGLIRWLNHATLIPRFAHLSRSYMLGTQQAIVNWSLSNPGDNTAPVSSSFGPLYGLSAGSGCCADAATEQIVSSATTARDGGQYFMRCLL